MGDRVCITGLGVVTALGHSPSELYRRLLAGETAVRHLSALGPSGLDVGPLAPVSVDGFPNEDGQAILTAQPRAGRLLGHCIHQALGQAGLLDPVGCATRRIGACLGTTLGEKTPWLAAVEKLHKNEGPVDIPLTGPALLARQLAFVPQRLRVVSAACCSGNAALALALLWLRQEACEVVVCAGVDVLEPFVLGGFRALRAQSPQVCRPFDRRRSGTNLGEASACVVLETQQHARARKQPVLAFLAGAGLARDANHMTGPDPTGSGACLAMRRAMVDAGLPPGAVDFVSSHGTGTPYNDLMEARALALLGAQGAPVQSIKGAIGHTLGASALVEAVMSVSILREGQIPPTAGLVEPDPQIALDLVWNQPRAARVQCVLSTSSGFGGENAAVVLVSAPGIEP